VWETGEMLSLIRNDTEMFFAAGTGMTSLDDYRHLGFTHHYPSFVGEVVGWSGECQKCFGTEVIIMSSISRNKRRSPECGVSDGIRGVDHHPYVMTRMGPSCRGMELDVYDPNPLFLSKMGIRARSAASTN